MLAYHNSVFAVFAVDWYAFASNFKRDEQTLRSFFLMSLISPRVSSLILLSFHTYCVNGHHRGTSFDMF